MTAKGKPIVDVLLRFYGDFLEPDKITNILQINPDKAKKVGEVTKIRNGKEVVAKTGLWRIMVDPAEYPTIDNRIAFIADLLKDSEIQSMKGQIFSDIVININIGVDEGCESVEWSLEPNVMKELSSYGVQIKFTVF